MDHKKLTKAEEEIMQMIWDNGAATVSQLIAQMPDPKPPHSTISSFVRILEKKGFLDHKAYGRTHEYFPLISKKEYSKFSLKNLVQNYFSNSTSELVSFLIKENDLSLSEMTELLKQQENEKS